MDQEMEQKFKVGDRVKSRGNVFGTCLAHLNNACGTIASVGEIMGDTYYDVVFDGLDEPIAPIMLFKYEFDLISE